VRFSLHLDQRLRDAQLLLQLGVAPFQIGDALVLDVPKRPAALLLGLQTTQALSFPLRFPGRQLRRVDAMAPKQLPDLAALGARIGFFQNARLVFRAETPSLPPIDVRRRYNFCVLADWFWHWVLTILAPPSVLRFRWGGVSPVIGTGGRRRLAKLHRQSPKLS